VTGTAVFYFRRRLRIDDTSKAERLQRFALAGCGVNKFDLAQLVTYVRHDRDSHDPFLGGHFDQWGCAQPDYACRTKLVLATRGAKLSYKL
jgi:hypothetical protein